MKTRKMVWCGILTVALLLGVLAIGCSGGDKPAEPDKPSKDNLAPSPDKPAPEPPAVEKPAPEKPAPDKPAEPPATPPETGKTGDAGAAGDLKSYEYIIEMESAEEGKMRMELKAEGKDKMMIKMSAWENNAWKEQAYLINDGKFSYMLDSANKSGMKMPQDKENAENAVPEDMMFVPEWKDYKEEYLKDAGIEKVGEEEVGAIKTTKYKVKGLEGADYGFVYVDDKDIMRKLEAFDPAGKLTISISFIKVELNPKFSASDFAPPPDYNIMDMSNMMNPNNPGAPPNMPNMPNMPEGNK